MADASPCLWDYASRLYSQVESACLQLQDSAGVDVNFLLFCCWAGKYHGAVSEQTMADLLEEFCAWSRQLVQPLRNSRRWWKLQAGNPAGDELYQLLKATELAAEKHQLLWLEGSLQHRALQPDRGCEAAITSNVRLYLTRAALVLDREAEQALDVLLRHATTFSFSRQPY